MRFQQLVRLAAAALAVVTLAAQASADGPKSPKGVIELFTSQGCSSCSPADAIFAEMAEKGDVVALAYHIDYWDYLGWRDTLGSPENTARQKDYMRAFGSGSVYTPQAVINGRTHVKGSDRQAIEAALGEIGDLPVPVSVRRTGDSMVIEVGESSVANQKAHVLLVYYDLATPVTIKEGENRDRTLTYWNPVTDIQTAGIWHGAVTRFEMPVSEISKKGTGGCAVLIQSVGKDGAPGPIVGATTIPHPGNLHSGSVDN